MATTQRPQRTPKQIEQGRVFNALRRERGRLSGLFAAYEAGADVRDPIIGQVGRIVELERRADVLDRGPAD